MRDLPPELDQELEAMMWEIHAAFKDVTREGELSWHETFLFDSYGESKGKKRTEARYADQDTCWTHLAHDDSWIPGPGVGGFVFLDPIGFRYYAPAGMIRFLESGHDAFPSADLHSCFSASGARLTLLDDRQIKCIARFLEFVDAFDVIT